MGAKEHKANIAYGLEVYEAAALEAWAVAAEGGAIPGVEKVSKGELFRFFEGVSPGEWMAEMQRDPDGALDMLRRYVESAPEKALAEVGGVL